MKTLKFLIVVQARETSTRLPKKVLETIGDKPLLLHISRRLQQCQIPFVFAIPENQKQSQMTELFQKEKLDFITGSEQDVFERYVKAAQSLSHDDYIIRMTGDNPFIDIKALQIMQQLVTMRRPEYAHFSGLPLGMGFEFVQKSALLRQAQMPMQDYHHEHVTLLIRENPQLFDFYKVELFVHVPTIRMTIDEPIDLEQARLVYQYFQEQDKIFFGAADVYDWYNKDNTILTLNAAVGQRKQ